ncbi:MAG: hypothetical protein E7360_06360, partial [Clostridiales bacterium]|nr:hypothetical protein [Clostridiales bacterium]
MGKIFKKLIALLLGAVMGITSIVATAVTSVYYLYGEFPIVSVLVPDDGDATTDKKDALGDLNDYSLEDVLALFNKGIAAPENFTIADLEEKYGLNIVELLNSLGSKDKPLVDTTDSEFLNDLKSVSIFTLFSGEGMDRFLADLPVSVVLGFIPEDTILAKEERAKLRGYSVGQLMSTDELTGQLGVLSALSEIKLGGIIPQMFEKGEDGNYVAKEGNPNFLNLLANVEFGAITNVATGKTSFGDELVDGGFSSLGDLSVGDVVSTFVEGDAEIAKTLDGLFNGMTFDELFEKDATTGKNKFVLDKLLDNVKVGAVLGYVKDEEGDWCEKAEDGTAGKPVNGLLEKIASLDLTTLVHAFTEGGETADKIHKALLVFGDISVGDVFETLGYSQSEDGTWLKKDGAPVKSPLLTALFDISIKDIVGDADQKLSVDAVRNNIVNAISSSCEGLTVGEGLGELLGIELVDGKYVHTKGDKQGKEVNVFMQRLLSVELSNVVASLGGEKIDANNLLRVFEDALAGATVGDLLGAEYINGKWYSNEQPVSGFLSIVYDIDFLGVFSIIREAQSGKFSYAKVIESFLPEIEIGDIVTAITKVTVNTEGEEDVYFDKDGKALSSGLNTILNLKLWQVAAGFDANHPYNLKEVIKDITVGDALSLGKDQNGWLITADKYATGAIEDLLDYTLGDLIATEDKTMKDKVTATLKAVTVGDIFTLALGYNDAEGKFAKDKTAEDTNQFLKALCLWDSMSIGRVLDIVSGKEKLDMETLRTELNTAFGEVLFGEPWRGLLTEKDGDGLTFKALKEASGILDPIFSAKFSVYFNIIFDVIGGKSLDLVAILDSIYGDATLGDLIAPIVKIEKAENGIYETSKDKSLGEAITALLDTQIVATVDNFVNKEITDKIGNLFDNKIVNIDFMLGNYVETFLNLVYDEEKEWTKNGESVYAPLNKVLAINLYELVSTILDKEMTSTEKRDYFVDLFDGLTVGDLASIVVKGDTNKELLDDIIFPIVITDVINDVFAKTPILDIVKKYVGEIQVGHIVDLIVEANENGTASRSVADKQVWVKANGTEYESVLSNVFSVSVNDVFGWLDTKPFDVKKIINDVVGENSLADFADIFLEVGYGKRASGLTSVGFGTKLLPAIVGDILNVKVGQILDWTGMKGNDMVNAIVSGICNQTTFGQYINDLVPAKENQTAIMDKEVFKNLKDKAVATFVADLLIAENKGTYLKGYLDGVYVGDIVTLTGLLKGADGNWTNKNDKEIASPLESLCDVTFDQLFAWLDEKPIDVKGIVNDVFGDDSIADFADIFLDVETENVKRENGLDSVKINGKVLPVIVGDILSVTVGDVLDWTGKQGNDMINAIVSGICNQTTFGQYINDLVPAKENQTAIMDKEVFKNLKNKAVATFVADLLIAENKVTYLKGYLDGVYVGDIVTLTGLLKGADGNWTNKNDKEIASPIESLCDVTFDQLFAWLDEKPIDVKGIVNDVFGDDSIADFADI